jgi:hypothetical protein
VGRDSTVQIGSFPTQSSPKKPSDAARGPDFRIRLASRLELSLIQQPLNFMKRDAGSHKTVNTIGLTQQGAAIVKFDVHNTTSM